jgi:pyruvate dehydrogenase phosphatase
MKRWWEVWKTGAPGADEEGRKDLMLFSVLDGHAGDATSQLLSKTLHPTLALSLAELQAGYFPSGGSKWAALADYLNPALWVPGKVWTPENVSKSIQSA